MKIIQIELPNDVSGESMHRIFDALRDLMEKELPEDQRPDVRLIVGSLFSSL